MKKLCIFWLLIFIPLVNSCSDDSEPEISSLNIGNEWTYKISVIRKTDNQPIYEFSYTGVITGTEIVNDKVWYMISSNGQAYSSQRIDADGLWERYTADKPELLAPYPSNVGDNHLLWSTDSSQKFLITNATNYKVKVAAGSFTCYEYAYKYVENGKESCTCDEKTYYSPRVGLIKKIVSSQTAITVTELVSFKKK